DVADLAVLVAVGGLRQAVRIGEGRGDERPVDGPRDLERAARTGGERRRDVDLVDGPARPGGERGRGGKAADDERAGAGDREAAKGTVHAGLPLRLVWRKGVATRC